MSFSEQIKEEILNNTKMKTCCKSAIHYGELFTEEKLTKTEIKEIIAGRTCCKRAFLQGIFLGSGYVVSPKSKYHFEVSLDKKEQANFVIALLNDFDIKAKCIKRNTYVVYIKDGENISHVLRVFGVTSALIDFENARIEKSIKNDINRGINCETANLNKIVESAYKQIRAINILKERGEYSSLNQELKELCEHRINNPEASLEELATLCNYDISKSGVYHRLNKIIKLSEKV